LQDFSTLIRLGIVGSNYGRNVQLPAFRADARCQVVAIAASDGPRAAQIAAEAGIAKGHGGWRSLIEDCDVDAVAIATLPSLQAEIALSALKLGKPVFAEKPMASDLAGARAMLRAADRLPTAIDFNFHQVVSWQRAKQMLDAGAVGRLRHMVVNWQVESRAIQTRMHSWKTLGDDGGGVLGNFISHCFHYLEWFGGPLTGLSARIAGLPDDPTLETTAMLTLQFQTGALCSLSMSCASYMGGGHRIEFFGDDGSLVLHNPTTDYMRGFTLQYAKRQAATVETIAVVDMDDAQYPDGRIAPTARLAKMFLDAIENGGAMTPGFAQGYRVQQLMDAARRAHDSGHWREVAP
jgi:predicted dehydrogenase